MHEVSPNHLRLRYFTRIIFREIMESHRKSHHSLSIIDNLRFKMAPYVQIFVVGCSNGAAMMQCRALFLHLLKALRDDEWRHCLRKGNGYLAVEMLHHLHVDFPKPHPGKCRSTKLLYSTRLSLDGVKVRHPHSHPPSMPIFCLLETKDKDESWAKKVTPIWSLSFVNSEFRTSNLTEKQVAV